jgi:hypothetical protein
MYASQVVDMRRQVDCVKFSLQQEQEKQRIVEKKTQELREMLSRELVESQRYVKLALSLLNTFTKSLYPWCLQPFLLTHCYEHHDGAAYRRWENFI